MIEPDPVAKRILKEAGGNFNQAVTRLRARFWTKDEAESELRLCLQSKGLRRAPRNTSRANHGEP